MCVCDRDKSFMPSSYSRITGNSVCVREMHGFCCFLAASCSHKRIHSIFQIFNSDMLGVFLSSKSISSECPNMVPIIIEFIV